MEKKLQTTIYIYIQLYTCILFLFGFRVWGHGDVVGRFIRGKVGAKVCRLHGLLTYLLSPHDPPSTSRKSNLP